MDTTNVAAMASQLSVQQSAQQQMVATLKLSNDQIEAQGQAVLKLLDAVPVPQGNLGNIINVKV
ncbi:hypothetical protein C9933_00820 [Methylophaga nitratireducenticrescens]|mgnify:FL=1|jgi:hypothetical protein|uniref:YjfB family protein n=1 Tax=unclassified Methylophaga TaxID=2629249 RepID=UPI000C0F1449|nr:MULTISPECIES: YjfB family protein [unclassified Methylophaga]PTB82766.1 hypothetical protein C9933_00820 [Methylophaga nitratireducenticrescens]MAL49280.1 hypothetical protein [Methylophaga sp.]MAP27984.1 hypothetical protein [Methylophaga sp.]MBL1458890.1 hypothetical protein [Methylophaga sp.]MBP25935.1 hypothetical protein [Methylophaga sp.]|tara:strand:- start:133 stop:324 length:192 start_codon:yes stop_codon:yes gene_type:complete